MAVVLSNQLGPKLIELLGLPKRTASFELRFESNKAVVVNCTYYPDERVGDVIELIAKEYELHEKERDVSSLADETKRVALAGKWA